MRRADEIAIRLGGVHWHRYVRERRRGNPGWSADLSQAWLGYSNLMGLDLRRADLSGANLKYANLLGADLSGSNLADADLYYASLIGVNLTGANLARMKATNAALGWTVLIDVNVSALCDAKRLRHANASFIDSRTITRSSANPGLREFLVSCGVPPHAIGRMAAEAKREKESKREKIESKATHLQSTFISYGQPDDAFARRLYHSLTERDVKVFYFPLTARLGERLSNEVHYQLNSHERVILICSQGSLNRPGVLNEIQETFDREARDAGAAYLIPIALDDYLFDANGWEKIQPDLTRRVRARIVGDFRAARSSATEYRRALDRLIDALSRRPRL